MRIIGFDSAVENLGVCCVEYDENFGEKIKILTNDLDAVFQNIKNLSKKLFIKSIHDILKKLNYVYNNAIKITYVNVFDLIPGEDINKTTVKSITEKLKYLLNYIDNIFPNVDIVLIEYQMKQNSITPLISGQIMYHYAEIKQVPVTHANNKKGTHMNKPTGGITYGIEVLNDNKDTDENKLENKLENKTTIETDPLRKNIRIEFVGCGVKNSHKVVSDGDYSNFIEKYNGNYTANKKHTEYNFIQFTNMINDKPLMKLEDFFKKKRTVKYDDIADAFMMIYGWIADNLFTY